MSFTENTRTELLENGHMSPQRPQGQAELVIIYACFLGSSRRAELARGAGHWTRATHVTALRR